MPVLPDAQHERFAQERAQGKSQVDAYEAAGYVRNDGHAARLAGKKEVAARIAELMQAAAERAEITQADVLRELGKIGFANMSDYIRIGSDGDPFVDLSALTRDQAAAINEVTVEDFKDGRGEDARDVRKIKFKLSDKRAALVDIGKHLGMFKEGQPEPPQVNIVMPDAELARLIVFQLQKAQKQA